MAKSLDTWYLLVPRTPFIYLGQRMGDFLMKEWGGIAGQSVLTRRRVIEGDWQRIFGEGDLMLMRLPLCNARY